MESRQGNLIDALDRVEEFLETNDDPMGSVIPPPTRQKFSALRERLLAHMKSQDASGRVARSRAETKRQLRDELIDNHMRPIVAMARVELTVTPRPAGFRLPPRNGRFGVVVAAGYGLAEAAREFQELFVAGGFRPDFIERLVSATDALRDSANAKSQTTALRTQATAGLRKDGRAAKRYLRLLDSMIRAAIKTDNVLLDGWAHVSRVAAVAASAAESAGTPSVLAETRDDGQEQVVAAA